MGEIFAGLTRFTGNPQVDVNIAALILCAIVLCVPLLVAAAMPLFDRRGKNRGGSLYLYAFTAGFFLVLGLFGELNEGREIALAAVPAGSGLWVSVGYQAAVLGGGCAIGLGFALAMKLFVSRRAAKNGLDGPADDHDAHPAFHNHPHAHEALFSRQAARGEKAVALYLVLSHRLAAGFFLGITLQELVAASAPAAPAVPTGTTGVAFLIGFFLHLFPEEAVVYFRLRAMGASRLRAAGTSAALLLLLVPFVFLGANVGAHVSDLWWLNGIVHAVVGALLAFVAAVEFLPEAVREFKSARRGWRAAAVFACGLAACALVVALGGT